MAAVESAKESVAAHPVFKRHVRNSSVDYWERSGLIMTTGGSPLTVEVLRDGIVKSGHRVDTPMAPPASTQRNVPKHPHSCAFLLPNIPEIERVHAG
jgi:hypothetical protein